MQKEYIIAEIKRTTQQNSGIPLGKEKFSKVTGIKQSDWWGKHWRSWGDAVSEAGFSPNSMTEAYSKDFLLSSLAKLTKKLGRIPAEVDLRMERKANASFPSHSTFLNLGEHKDRIRLLRKFAIDNGDFLEVLDFLPVEELSTDLSIVETTSKTKDGFVYLMLLKLGKEKRYKIGKSVLVERRQAEISLHLPEEVELIHTIKTDDAYGIEAYWHKRFSNKNTNGEWFLLSQQDITAFKRRQFM